MVPCECFGFSSFLPPPQHFISIRSVQPTERQSTFVYWLRSQRLASAPIRINHMQSIHPSIPANRIRNRNRNRRRHSSSPITSPSRYAATPRRGTTVDIVKGSPHLSHLTCFDFCYSGRGRRKNPSHSNKLATSVSRFRSILLLLQLLCQVRPLPFCFVVGVHPSYINASSDASSACIPLQLLRRLDKDMPRSTSPLHL